MAIDKIGVYNGALRLLGEPDLVTLTDLVQSRYVLDGAYDDAIVFVLRQAAWRFALLTTTVAGVTSSLIPGYDHSFTKPATWLRTHAVYVLVGGDERPFDFREQAAKWYANVASLTARYVSTDGQTLSTWTEQFAKAVSAYLAFVCCDKITGDPDRTKQAHGIFQEFLQAAIDHDALPENDWLPHQMDGSLLNAGQVMLEKAFWNFALKTASPTASGTPVAGFTTAYPKPADWLRTHAIFKLSGSKECPVDVREQGASWSANEAIKVRYVSSDFFDSTKWPEEFMRVVGAFLGIDAGDGGATQDQNGQAQKPLLWPNYLQSAAQNISVPPSPWLTYQLDGSLLPAVNYLLEEGFWKFAMVTVSLTPNVATPSAGYAYAFDKPAPWIRTVEVYYAQGSAPNWNRLPIDYRDEGGDLHANYTPIVLRYLSSTLGRDSTAWSDAFEQTLLSYLALRRAVSQPDTPGAVLSARQLEYERLFENARSKDDMRERPRVNPASRLTSARRGGLSTFYQREQGW